MTANPPGSEKMPYISGKESNFYTLKRCSTYLVSAKLKIRLTHYGSVKICYVYLTSQIYKKNPMNYNAVKLVEH